MYILSQFLSLTKFLSSLPNALRITFKLIMTYQASHQLVPTFIADSIAYSCPPTSFTCHPRWLSFWNTPGWSLHVVDAANTQLTLSRRPSINWLQPWKPPYPWAGWDRSAREQPSPMTDRNCSTSTPALSLLRGMALVCSLQRFPKCLWEMQFQSPTMELAW